MRPRVALVGTFDVDNYGDHLFPRIAVRELARRLPGVVVDCYAPFGPRHRVRFSGGPPIHPLGAYSDERLDWFADRYDAMIVGGGELLHLNDDLLQAFSAVDASEVAEVQPSRWFLEGLGPAREARCPVLWNAIGVPYDLDEGQGSRARAAHASRTPPVVRDDRSRHRLLNAGVAPPVLVVPDSGLLVDRILDPDDLARRRRRLGIPPGTLVAQGCDLLVPFVAEVAAALTRVADEHGLEVTLVETGLCRGDGPYADALGQALAGRKHRRLSSETDLEDVAAVLASAALFVGSSLHGAITALVHGRPFVLTNLGDESKLRGFVESIGLEDWLVEEADDIPRAAAVARRSADDVGPRVTLLQDRVDRHFDALAATIVAGSRQRRRTVAPINALRELWAAARRRSEP